MTLSPELLAMIADVPEATDTYIEENMKSLKEIGRSAIVPNRLMLRLIARIVAEQTKGDITMTNHAELTAAAKHEILICKIDELYYSAKAITNPEILLCKIIELYHSSQAIVSAPPTLSALERKS